MKSLKQQVKELNLVKLVRRDLPKAETGKRGSLEHAVGREACEDARHFTIHPVSSEEVM